MKDTTFIDIYDAANNVVKMELILSFSVNNTNYIVYRELDSDKMYAAKFTKDINKDFDPNLTSEELEIVNKVYKEVQNDNE